MQSIENPGRTSIPSLPPAIGENSIASAPFVIEHERRNLDRGGYFTPSSKLVVTPSLRTSGLLRALPDREAKSLLLLLTYLTPNGRIEPTVAQLSAALGVPEIAVRSRLGKLTAFRWRGERIAHHTFRESGLDGYRLSHVVTAERQAPEQDAGGGSDGRPRKDLINNGAAVLSHSRARYARPRAEVERDIEQRLGYGGKVLPSSPAYPEPPEAREVRRRLMALGVVPAEAERLLGRHPLDEIRDQLDWLPDRAARSPARYVVAAIEGKYEAPARVRLQRAIAEDAEDQAIAAEETAGNQGGGEGGTTQNAVKVLPGLPSFSDLPEPILLYDSEVRADASGEAAAADGADHAVSGGDGSADQWDAAEKGA